jgi:hypothetical protein
VNIIAEYFTMKPTDTKSELRKAVSILTAKSKLKQKD